MSKKYMKIVLETDFNKCCKHCENLLSATEKAMIDRAITCAIEDCEDVKAIGDVVILK